MNAIQEPLVGTTYNRTNPEKGWVTVVGIAEHHITHQRNVVYYAESGEHKGRLYVTTLGDFSLRFKPEGK